MTVAAVPPDVDHDPPRPGTALRRAARPRQSPQLVALSYGMGPAALALLLVLRHFGLIARESVLAYVAVFTVIPAVSILVEPAHRRWPSRLTPARPRGGPRGRGGHW